MRIAVEASLSSYQYAARGDRPKESGREDFGMPVRLPYCPVRSMPAAFHTQRRSQGRLGGRLLRETGFEISGLFEGGGVTAGLSAAQADNGHYSGNGLLDAIELGRVTGENAARGRDGVDR